MNKNEKFNHDLKMALDIARHAPSSHNCQPWCVNVTDSVPNIDSIKTTQNSRFVTVSFDESRMLTSLPSLTGEMYTSCGIFTELLTQALVFKGYQCEEHWIDNEGIILILHLLPTETVSNHAFEQLQATTLMRFTNRGPYEQTKVDTREYESLIENLNTKAIHSQLINNPTLISSIANLIEDYAGLDFSNKKVWQETYSFIRFNDNETAEDGFYMRNLFGPVSWAFKQAFKFISHPKNHMLSKIVGLPNYMAKGLAELVDSTPQLIVFTAKNKSNSSYWHLGKDLSKVWQKAQIQGLSFHPLSVLLQNETPRKKLKNILGNKEETLFIARLGTAQSPATRAPRRQVASILN
ncbi:hypothetical protein [Pseudoalteromonas denitrificans]|uniref:Nitroreductase family protein n=1 Tax=Pseudoalteromonas denitrificans DSM 6059 TaxID=1123010 RepID=A0A1I1G1B7_9GAMM|nr:hypothetical protein [Pseudoalteromonas denitrificans]SFC05325.1 hypothetical protein SAMN02745724_00773 [Pseudoalteromonas denitrificans DSM 6059]